MRDPPSRRSLRTSRRFTQPSGVFEPSDRHRGVDQRATDMFRQRFQRLRLGSTGIDQSTIGSARQRPRIVPGTARAAPIETQRHQHVGRLGRRCRPVAQQLVRAERRPALQRTGNGEHLDTAFGTLDVR